jgi:hypothetical protein
MADTAASSADNGRRKIRPFVALPRLVALLSAVQALHVDLLQRPVQHRKLVHVPRSQCNCLKPTTKQF